MYDAGHPKPMLCDNLGGMVEREVEGGFRRQGIYVCLFNSCWWMTKTITILQSNYLTIKKKKKLLKGNRSKVIIIIFTSFCGEGICGAPPTVMPEVELSSRVSF